MSKDSIRTHYTQPEVSNIIRDKFPTISAYTVIKIKESIAIKYTHAGADVLLEVAEMERLIKAIAAAPLIEKNGWLVLPDSFQRN